MKKENILVMVERVKNGWVLSGSPYRMREGCTVEDTHVARNPQQLAGLLMAWGSAQEEADKK